MTHHAQQVLGELNEFCPLYFQQFYPPRLLIYCNSFVYEPQNALPTELCCSLHLCHTLVKVISISITAAWDQKRHQNALDYFPISTQTLRQITEVS